MNNNNRNVYNEKEIQNKLDGFQENQDYSVSPSEEPNQKNYLFHNTSLRNIFGVDRVPVRVWEDKYDDDNLKYRGHFEEGKDYYFSHQSWEYGKNYPVDSRGWKPVRASETYWGNGDYHKEWFAERESKEGFEKFEPLQSLPHYLAANDSHRLTRLKTEHNNLVAELNALVARPESSFGVDGKAKKESEIAAVKRKIAKAEEEIAEMRKCDELAEKPGSCCECGKKVNHSQAAVWHDRGKKGRFLLCSSECKQRFVATCEITGRCSNCDWDGIRPNDNYCQSCGISCKGDNKQAQVIHELSEQLQLAKQELNRLFAELKKLQLQLKNNPQLSTKINKLENKKQSLNSQYANDEIQTQLRQTNSLISEAAAAAREVQLETVASSPSSANKSNPLPYVAGGAGLLLVGGLAAYCWAKRKK